MKKLYFLIILLFPNSSLFAINPPHVQSRLLGYSILYPFSILPHQTNSYGLNMDTQHDTPVQLFNEQFVMGSGLNEIPGNKKHTFTLQLKHVFN